MRHLMSPLDFSVAEIENLLDLASDIKANHEKYAHLCDGKNLPLFSMNQVHEPDSASKLR